MNDSIKTVFDVSKPLTQGIVELKVIKFDGDYAIVKFAGGYNGKKVLRKEEYALDLATAIEVANLVKQRKMKSLVTQFEKLQNMRDFKIVMLEDKQDAGD